MKFKSPIFTQASGSIGGTTFSHNRGGMYTRARAIPTDPGTVQQVIVRNLMANLSNRWVNLLTAAQRAGWDNYASLVLLPDTLGEPRNVGGLAMYVRSNIPRVQSGLIRVDTAPTIFDLGDFTQPVIATITAPSALSLTFTDTDAWVSEDDSAMLLFGSRGVNPTINFFKGPYRAFPTQLVGQVAIPPTSPFAGVNPFPLVATQKWFLQLRVTRADGRLSSPLRISDIVIV